MNVYLVTMEAVYDHGCAGVFTTREAALAHAQALYEDSDMHHGFRVDAFTLDEPQSIEGRYECGFDASDPNDVARLHDQRSWRRKFSKVYCSGTADV